MLHRIALFSFAIVILIGHSAVAAEIDFEREIAPILKTYCAGCHNETDREGKLSLVSLGGLRAGTPDGPVVVPSKPEESKLLKLLAADADPKMPPQGEPQLSPEHIKKIELWITQGAKGTAAPITSLRSIKPPTLPKDPLAAKRVTAGCALPNGQTALGKFATVEVHNQDGSIAWVFDQVPGKVNQLRPSPDGLSLIAAGGVAGLAGEVFVLDIATGKVQQRLQGHLDAVYCATASADGRWIASGSYDRTVILWDRMTGKAIRSLSGHNGAIYDLDFDASSCLIATASGDQTVKVWNVQGERLDTMGQPQGEVLSVRFSPGGNHVFAAGADRQIRKWQLLSRNEPAINPLLVARFAHEDDCIEIEFAGPDLLISTSIDRTMKLWDTSQLRPLGQLATLSDVPSAIIVGEQQIQVISLDGVTTPIERSKLSELAKKDARTSVASPLSLNEVADDASEQLGQFADTEPNDALSNAVSISLPAQVKGAIGSGTADRGDSDLYRFTTKAGQQWVFEINAARSNSPLDSRLEVLDDQGKPVLQTRLQATRESYFTFRGKDSSTSDDFRVHNWEDMELNEFLYSDGEIVKLWLYPRGPDSGFKVYPGFGSRFTYFNSTPTAHALGAAAYIVRELVDEEEPLPNGLPVFPVYAENDDDGLRRWGKDSRLVFTAPRTGDYFVKVRDARDFGGEDFSYQLDIHRPRPNFEVKVGGNKMKMPVGVGREWQVTATRFDGMDGPIAVTIDGLPKGFVATNPLIIEADQLVASGAIFATTEATKLLMPSDEKTDAKNQQSTAKFALSLVARGEHRGRTIEHQLKEKIELELDPTAELTVKLLDAQTGTKEIDELTIRPGQTISARVLIDRAGTNGPISFGKEDSGRNLPHGTIIDNIGLNGLLLPDGTVEREFFITASQWLAPQRRQFHLRCEAKGNATSRPIWLNVVP
jgi:WD40 repeat protein